MDSSCSASTWAHLSLSDANGNAVDGRRARTDTCKQSSVVWCVRSPLCVVGLPSVCKGEDTKRYTNDLGHV